MSNLKISKSELLNTRVFINDVDSFNGRYLAPYISSLAYRSAVALPIYEEVFGEDDVRPDSPVVQEIEKSEAIPGEDAILPNANYEVIGTVCNKSVKELPGVKEILPRKNCMEAARNAKVFIFDISQKCACLDELFHLLDLIEHDVSKEAEAVVAHIGEYEIKVKYKVRRIILVSTVLTWAGKIMNSTEEQDEGMNEDNFAKRYPNDNYTSHYDFEERIIGLAKRFKETVQAIIITPGLTYGFEENLFFSFFQMAWENEKIISIYGNGRNNLPVIHVRDLVEVIGSMLLYFPVSKTFIFAMEKDMVTLEDIIFKIGKSYGSGYFQYIPKKEIIFLPGMSSHMYYHLTVDLVMEPNYIYENKFRFIHTCSFLDDMDIIYQEFKDKFHLKPHKIILYGPPAAGKTDLATSLSNFYGISIYSDKILTELIIDELKWKINFYNNIRSEDDEPNETNPKIKRFFTLIENENIDDLKLELDEIQSVSVIPKDKLIQYLQKKIDSCESKNKGWILEGYPKLYQECSSIFGALEDEDLDSEKNEENSKDESVNHESALKLSFSRYPDLVVSLEASDLFLCEQIMIKREKQILNLPYSELDLIKNLKEFRKFDNFDQTLLTYFEDANIDILKIDLTEKDLTKKIIFKKIVETAGEPCTTITKEIMETQSEMDLRLEKNESERLNLIKESIDKENKQHIKQWTTLYKILKDEETERLHIHSDALRQYLMRSVFPLLTKGLTLVSKLRPADPVDFLAEYLFRENTSGKLFDPGFNLCADHLMILIDEVKKSVNL